MSNPDPEPVDIIILAGGKGTRLQQVVFDVPKPLAPVCGRPFIDYMLDIVAQSECVGKAVLALGHLAPKIIEHYEKVAPPLPLEFVVEEEPLGTGGALVHALSKTRSNTILACNGDSLARWDLKGLLTAHHDFDTQATIATTQVKNASRYGTCILEENRITGFREKAPYNIPGTINLGLYAFERTAFNNALKGAHSLESDILPALAAKGQLHAYPMSGPFLDIGLPQSYRAAEEFLRSIGLRHIQDQDTAPTASSDTDGN